MNFVDHNAFDAYAKGRGWRYDNSGLHQGELWDWYFQQDSDAKLVLLRQLPDKAALVRVEGLKTNLLWAGQIAGPAQFDAFMKVYVQVRDATATP